MLKNSKNYWIYWCDLVKNFKLVFDDVIIRQLQKLGEDSSLHAKLGAMLDKMEELGPRAGKLIDSHLFLYEVKSKHPPLRLYYKHVKETDELYVFEYEMKTSEEKQKKTIGKLKQKVHVFRNRDRRA